MGEHWDSLLYSLVVDHKAKNISYNPASGALKGTIAPEKDRLHLQTMMAAFSTTTAQFVCALLPSYA